MTNTEIVHADYTATTAGPIQARSAMAISVQHEGRRFYLVGNTFPIKDQLRSCGAKWDADRRAWWTSKLDVAERFAGAEPAASSDAAPDSRPSDTLTDDSRIAGKATYKGKPYILVWEGETRRGRACKLAFSDGSKVFWADAADVQVTKRYDSREYRGRVEHMTFGRLARLREKFARARGQGYEDGICDGQTYECPECGERVVRGHGSCWETGCAH